jgi:hypothetical protein
MELRPRSTTDLLSFRAAIDLFRAKARPIRGSLPGKQAYGAWVRNEEMLPQPSAQDLNNVYSDLLDDLSDAYWAAGTLQVKDQLYGVIEAVTDVISALDAADLQTRDARNFRTI